MISYLVTGGAGFIGSHIVDALLAEGANVRVLDNLATGKRENLAHVASDIEFLQGDVRDADTVGRAVRGMDYVLHQAALPSVPRSIQDPLSTHEVNVTGTVHLLNAARDAKVRRLVFASSSSVYGDTPELPKHEGMVPRPRSPYAVSKLAGEQYCRAFWHSVGLETVCLRYFNIFGPRQDPTSAYAAVIPRFATALLSKGRIHIYGDGQQTRDFTFVANAVSANLLAAVAPEAAGTICNIACGERTSLLTLVGVLAKLANCQADVVHDPERAGDVKDSLADIGLARERLGYVPAVKLTDGLRTTFDWVRQSISAACP